MDNNFGWNLGGDFIAHRGRTNSSKTKIDRQSEFNQRRVAIDSKYDAMAEELDMMYKAEMAKGNKSDKNKLRKLQMASEKIVEDWQRELADLKEKIFNSGDDFIAHYGTKRHSGRYPWGSGEKNGKTPIHEHGEKKHKSSSNSSNSDIENKVAQARKTGKYAMEFLEQNGDLDQKTGELLKGKELDDSYRKWLEKNSNSSHRDVDMENNGKLKIPTKPLYETKTTGSLFNKRKETVLTEAGKQWQRDVADKTKSYYENMSEKDINAHIKAQKKYKEALDREAAEKTMTAYKNTVAARQEMYGLRNADANKILNLGDRSHNIYGNYVDNHDAFNLGMDTFHNEFDKFFKKRFIQHSNLYDDSFISAILEVLDKPI